MTTCKTCKSETEGLHLCPVKAERRAKGLCPTCGVVRLSRVERARGYQCRDCTAQDVGYGMVD